MQLSQEGIHPLVDYVDRKGGIPTPWTAKGWNVFLDNEPRIDRAIVYVERNPEKEGKPRQRWPSPAAAGMTPAMFNPDACVGLRWCRFRSYRIASGESAKPTVRHSARWTPRNFTNFLARRFADRQRLTCTPRQTGEKEMIIDSSNRT